MCHTSDTEFLILKQALDKINNSEIFNDELYFAGGTALAYYLNHRVSKDIDIVSSKALNYKTIIPNISILGATKLQDENVTALRMAGMFPDEYMIKFILDNVKLDFFKLTDQFKNRYSLLLHLSALKIQN